MDWGQREELSQIRKLCGEISILNVRTSELECADFVHFYFIDSYIINIYLFKSSINMQLFTRKKIFEGRKFHVKHKLLNNNTMIEYLGGFAGKSTVCPRTPLIKVCARLC